MKNILPIIFALLLAASAFADQTTITLTITNAPADSATLVVNGSTRTWKDTVATPATQIQTTNTIVASITNLFAQVVANNFTAVRVSSNSTTSINFISQSALTITTTGSWASLTTNIVTTTNWYGVQVPASNYLPADATNIFSMVLSALNTYSTNTFAAGAVALTNHVNRTAAQTISGAKTFTGANIYSNAAQMIVGGTNSGQTLIGVVSISGFVGSLVNGTWTTAALVDGANSGLAFSSAGAGSGSEQFGASAQANGTHDLAVGNGADAEGGFGIAIGDSAFSDIGGSAVGRAANATKIGSSVFGSAGQAIFDYSTAVGFGSATTVAHQIMLGTSGEFVQFPGGILFTGAETNFTGAGTNTITGQLAFPRKNNTSLANGGNAAIDISTNVNVFISGPSSAYSTDGIAGGSDGRVVTLTSRVNQTWTIPNESGTDPTAANRIQTGTGSTVTLTGNPTWASFLYDATASRWILMAHGN